MDLFVLYRHIIHHKTYIQNVVLGVIVIIKMFCTQIMGIATYFTPIFELMPFNSKQKTEKDNILLVICVYVKEELFVLS